MANRQVARDATTRKTPSLVAMRGDVPQDQAKRPERSRRVRTSPTPHLTSDQCAQLLTVIDDAGGAVTIDAISRALPRVSQPVSAVFDLCDAGILNVDWEAAFDGDMHVWRIDH